MRFFVLPIRWCHNGWAYNILIVVDVGVAGIHHLKYWMPIHYDTIEDGQNKKSHLLFFKSKMFIYSCSLFFKGCHVIKMKKQNKTRKKKKKTQHSAYYLKAVNNLFKP